jgi:isoleucyl-tRNA synthetase
MAEAYKIVKLGRSARNTANIKNRQPLLEMLVSIKTLPQYYGDIIKEELNIKNIEFNADLSKYVNFNIKPNLPVLGKEYGRLIPQITKEISSMDQVELAQKVNNNEAVKINVGGSEIELNSDNLLITMEGLEGFAFASEGSIGIVLETKVTEQLKEEGNLREILSKIQNMRKESGFEVADKINLYISGNDKLETVVKKFENRIKKETLSLNIIYNADRKYNKCNINGKELDIAVELVK